MEAEDYFSTYDALHAGNSPVRRLELRLRNVSSISKVVWSSFDFMCGPELKFVWEISPSSSVSPVNLSGEEGSVNDAESLDSSMTTSTVQFEDIDDPLQIALTSTTGLYDSMFMDDSMYHEYHLSSRGGYTFQELRYLDEFMMDSSNYSGTDSSTTMTDSRMQGNSPVRRLELRLRNVSSISKVVWSSFDFMCGPELKFVWEISPSSSVSPVNLSGEEGSVNDAESLDSSMTTSTVQFEDIDDPLQIALTSTTGLYDSMFMDDSMYHEYHLSSRGGYTFQELRYLDEFMMDSSNYSGTDSSTTMTDSRMQNPVHGRSTTRSTSSATTLTMENSCEDLEKKEEGDDESAGPVDPMAGTPMELMNISTLLSSEPGARQSQDTSDTATLPARHTSGSSTTGGKTSTSSFAKLSDEDGNNQDKSIEEREGVDSEKVANALTTSCVDSGIGGTISTHSDLSALCLSPLAESSSKEQRKTFETIEGKPRTRLSHESTNGSFDDEVVSVLDLPLDAPSDPPAMSFSCRMYNYHRTL
ncbi:hypothetical protein ANCDUO_03859 [Ancylostoma duodenale]|uniref:Uncharacterized protein n=1 Tax=Ancylostoma duodenale TaxID=51022 RepID=A0A0C2DSS3_9BILA|nr:hypothetical protein ANCDUO_03859 [Ancylostoma duodenale]